MASESSLTLSLSLGFAGGAVNEVSSSSLFLTNIFTPRTVSERLYLPGLGEGHLPDDLLKQLQRLLVGGRDVRGQLESSSSHAALVNISRESSL